MDDNRQDVTLLIENPGQLIINYQQLIEVMVLVFIRTGYFPKGEKEEIIQLINERLLSRIPRIREQYNGHSRLRTYLSVIIRNIILERVREKHYLRRVELVEEFIREDSYYDDHLSRMIIEQETQRLAKIFHLFCTKAKKLELCFKLIFRIPLTIEDFTEYRDDFRLSDFQSYCHNFKEPDLCTDLEIYAWLTALINRYEGKETSSDATRKWIKQKLEEVINLLNGNPKTSNYNFETLQILFEKYHQKKKDKNTFGIKNIIRCKY